MAYAAGNFMRFINKNTGQSYASPQQALAATQGAGAGGSAGGNAVPQGPQVSQQAAGRAWSQATGNPYFGPGSFRGSHSQPAANVQDWYAKYGQGSGGGGAGGSVRGAPQGPAAAPQGMAGGGPGYATGVPTTVDEAHARALGNTRTDRDLYNSPQAQALMGNIHSTAVGGSSPMLNQLSQMTQAGKAQAADANARMQQLQQQQMARYGSRAGVNTTAAQIQSRADAARNLMADYAQRDIGHSAQALRLMGAAQDQYMGALRDMGMHLRGVSGMENQILSQFHEVEDDAFSGWADAFAGGAEDSPLNRSVSRVGHSGWFAPKKKKKVEPGWMSGDDEEEEVG